MYTDLFLETHIQMIKNDINPEIIERVELVAIHCGWLKLRTRSQDETVKAAVSQIESALSTLLQLGLEKG
jgi:hypothetical protein